LIKTRSRLATMVLLIIIVPVATIWLIVKLVSGGMHVDPDSPAMSEDAIADRLKPVGQVSVVAAADSSAAPEASGTPATGSDETMADANQPAADKAPEPAAGAGERVYNTSCQVCHGAGLAGAPKVGDKAAWKARIAQGVDVLYKSAINGKNAMPPKGGAVATPDADIKAAVDIMVARSS
jgi:cytochrome c5